MVGSRLDPKLGPRVRFLVPRGFGDSVLPHHSVFTGTLRGLRRVRGSYRVDRPSHKDQGWKGPVGINASDSPVKTSYRVVCPYPTRPFKVGGAPHPFDRGEVVCDRGVRSSWNTHVPANSVGTRSLSYPTSHEPRLGRREAGRSRPTSPTPLLD